MPRSVKFNGVTHTFPDDATDQEIESALNASEPKQDTSVMGFMKQAVDVNPIAQGLIGVGKGIGTTGAGLTSLVGLNPPPGQIPALQPTNTYQTIGKAAEQMGELFIPGLGEEKAVTTVAKVLPKVSPTLLKAIYNGLTTGGIATAQTGEPEKGMTAAVVAGSLSALGDPIQKGMNALGQKIQLSTIRPRKVDYEDMGTDDPAIWYRVLNSLGLKGNLSQSYKQVKGKIESLVQTRNALIDPATATPINLDRIFADEAADLGRQSMALKNAGEAKAYSDALAKLYKDIGDARQGNMMIDIREAENAKEHFGDMGEWLYGSKDKEAGPYAQIATNLYKRLKREILSSAPQGSQIDALNKEIQNLIPVKKAMIARIPVEERNRVMSLSDLLTMVPAAVTGDVSKGGLLTLSLLQKNHRFGSWLARQEGAGDLVRALSREIGGMGTYVWENGELVPVEAK